MENDNNVIEVDNQSNQQESLTTYSNNNNNNSNKTNKRTSKLKYDYVPVVLEEKRVRKSTQFTGAYNPNNDYDNIYEDEEDEIKDEDDDNAITPAKSRRSLGVKSATKSSSKGKRSKECPGCGELVTQSDKVCLNCDYAFSNKSLTNSQFMIAAAEESLSIRDQFAFEPVREEDGSLLIQAVLGRKLRKEEKVKGGYKSRWDKRKNISDITALAAKYDYEYLIKYKSISYLHVQWVTATDLDAMNLKSRNTLIRYLNKLDKGDPNTPDEAEVDPSFIEIERILDCREEEIAVVVDDDTNVDAPDYVPLLSDIDEVDSVSPIVFTDFAKENNTSLSSSTSNVSLTTIDKVESNNSLIAVTTSDVKDGFRSRRSTSNKDSINKDSNKDSDANINSIINNEDNEDNIDDFLYEDNEEDKLLKAQLENERKEERDQEREKQIGKSLQQLERCKHVIAKIWDDPFASGFHFPVDTELYDDYLDIIDTPMSLSEINNKLEAGHYNKYGQYKNIATDMRLIFNNCKKYNLYKSQIWYAAHSLSLLFERLYQAWVTAFSDGAISIEDPIGRPWEALCRVCLEDKDGEQTILCDHCDALCHTYCCSPPLTKIPDEPWVCPHCKNWFQKMARTSLIKIKAYSAHTEEEARAIAEGATSQKVIHVMKKKYLVKWRGLPYRECTWETVADINDDKQIAKYHELNDKPPVEPPMTQAEIQIEIEKDRRYPPAKAYPSHLQDLDSNVYSQHRVMQFIKHNMIPPVALLNESGPLTAAFTHGVRLNLGSYKLPIALSPLHDQTLDNRSVHSKLDYDASDRNNISKDKDGINDDRYVYTGLSHSVNDPVFNEVGEHLSNMCATVARNTRMSTYPIRPCLPPSDETPSELEVAVPKGNKPLGIGLGKLVDGRSYFVIAGFAPVDELTGMKSYAETCGRIKIGDIIIGINNIDIHDWSMASIEALITSYSNPYIYLRLLRIPGFIGRQVDCVDAYYREVKDLDRENVKDGDVYNENNYFIRSLYFGVFPTTSDLFTTNWRAEIYDDNSKMMLILGVFTNELDAAITYDRYKRIHKNNEENNDGSLFNLNFIDDSCNSLTNAAQILCNMVIEERNRCKDLILIRENIILANELKNINNTFNDDENENNDLDDDNNEDSKKMIMFDSDCCDSDSDSEDEDQMFPWDIDHDNKGQIVDHNTGPLGKLLKAVNLCQHPPNPLDFANHVLDVGLKVEVTTVKGKRRFEQRDMVSMTVIKEWDSVTFAARAVNVSVPTINNCLNGKSDTAGGFKWNYIDGPKTVMKPIVTATTTSDIDRDTSEINKDMDIEVDVDVDRHIEETNDDKIVVKTSKDPSDNWMNRIPKVSQTYLMGGKLRDYQLEGLAWLCKCWYSKRSCILADEMGLGKTVQVVTFLHHLYDKEKLKGPFLVCVPLSTIGHWRREFENWSEMYCCNYHDAGGGKDMRDIIREYDWYYKGRSRRLLKFHVLITTYDDLIKDFEELAEVPWRCVVIDEAHRLKSQNSKLNDCMRSVIAKGAATYGYQHRILMTGTPLQNNTSELFSLLNFIEPTKFVDADKFNARYGNIQTQEQVESLQKRIAPHLLRRVKEDVAKDIPPKEETIVDVELTTMQKQYYRAIFEHNIGFLKQSLKNNQMPKLMNIQMELRKCCNHPFLINGVEQTEMELIENSIYDQSLLLENSNKKFDQDYEYHRRRIEDVLIPSSGKLVLVDKLLPKLKREGHKVLIFSQMVKMIDLIEEYCEFKKYSCERLDGRVSGNDRQKAIDRYNKNDDSFVFLLSTRAGGVGINLTAADTVIIFDSDWNPQNDVQAMARCHRIGQQKQVKIYRLITRRSFEAEMFDRASKKLGLEQALLGSRNFTDENIEENNKNNEKMDSNELEKLLREGAYAVLVDDDTDMKEFVEEDIDSILSNRTHTLVSEAGNTTESWLNKKQKNKPKARKSMFTGDSSMEHAQIDVNDPDFWKKVMPDMINPDTMIERLSEILMEPNSISGDCNANSDNTKRQLDANGDVVKKKRGRKPKNQVNSLLVVAVNANGARLDTETNIGHNLDRESSINVSMEEFNSIDDTVNNQPKDPTHVQIEKNIVSDEEKAVILDKFFVDLTVMMENLKDLHIKGTLPDRERSICIRLLLKLTQKVEDFNEYQRVLAQEWLTLMEGSRMRKRTDNSAGNIKKPNKNGTNVSNRGRKPLNKVNITNNNPDLDISVEDIGSDGGLYSENSDVSDGDDGDDKDIYQDEYGDDVAIKPTGKRTRKRSSNGTNKSKKDAVILSYDDEGNPVYKEKRVYNWKIPKLDYTPPNSNTTTTSTDNGDGTITNVSVTINTKNTTTRTIVVDSNNHIISENKVVDTKARIKSVPKPAHLRLKGVGRGNGRGKNAAIVLSNLEIENQQQVDYSLFDASEPGDEEVLFESNGTIGNNKAVTKRSRKSMDKGINDLGISDEFMGMIDDSTFKSPPNKKGKRIAK